MTIVQAVTGIAAETIRHECVVFVEGESSESLDPCVLKALFSAKTPTPVLVKPLRSAHYLATVAQALAPHHPNYCFVIDRDYHIIDDKVNEAWDTFPNPETQNLLIWRRKELENYFLDPAFLSQSEYAKKDEASIAQALLKIVNKRLFWDAANYTVVRLREQMKAQGVLDKFSFEPKKFATKEAALEQLSKLQPKQKYQERLEEVFPNNRPETLFTEILNAMTGGHEKASLGKGRWLEMTSGKEVLNGLVHSSLFKVQDSKNKDVQGQKKLNRIAEQLLLKCSDGVPKDFIGLKASILKKAEALSLGLPG